MSICDVIVKGLTKKQYCIAFQNQYKMFKRQCMCVHNERSSKQQRLFPELPVSVC